jgi:hypothetical protein
MIGTRCPTLRKRRVLLISVSLLVVAYSQSSEVAVREVKRADIAKLLDVSQEATVPEAQSELLASQISAELKRSNPSISAKALGAVPHAVRLAIATALPEFKEGIARVYDRHFSAKEIRDMLQFRASSAARAVSIPSRETDETLRVLPRENMRQSLVALLARSAGVSAVEKETIVNYYMSDTGRKEIAVIPRLVAERAAAAEKFSAKLTNEIEAHVRAALLEEGILLSN